MDPEPSGNRFLKFLAYALAAIVILFVAYIAFVSIDALMGLNLYSRIFQEVRNSTSWSNNLVGAVAIWIMALTMLAIPTILSAVVFKRRKAVLLIATGLSMWMVATYAMSQPPAGELFNPYTGEPRYVWGTEANGQIILFPLGYRVHPEQGTSLQRLDSTIASKYSQQQQQARPPAPARTVSARLSPQPPAVSPSPARASARTTPALPTSASANRATVAPLVPAPIARTAPQPPAVERPRPEPEPTSTSPAPARPAFDPCQLSRQERREYFLRRGLSDVEQCDAGKTGSTQAILSSGAILTVEGIEDVGNETVIHAAVASDDRSRPATIGPPFARTTYLTNTDGRVFELRGHSGPWPSSPAQGTVQARISDYHTRAGEVLRFDLRFARVPSDTRVIEFRYTGATPVLVINR